MTRQNNMHIFSKFYLWHSDMTYGRTNKYKTQDIIKTYLSVTLEDLLKRSLLLSWQGSSWENECFFFSVTAFLQVGHNTDTGDTFLLILCSSIGGTYTHEGWHLHFWVFVFNFPNCWAAKFCLQRFSVSFFFHFFFQGYLLLHSLFSTHCLL